MGARPVEWEGMIVPDAWIPTQLQPLTGGVRRVRAPGGTVGEVVAELERRFPGIEARLVHEGEVMPGMSVVVDGDQTQLGLLQPVEESSEVHFIPAVGGG